MNIRISQKAVFWGLVAVSLGVLAGVIATVGPAKAVVGNRVNVPPPRLELRYAAANAPYEVKEPRYLPDGMYLLSVLNSPESPEAYSVDLSYIADDGRELHVWMTNNGELSTAGKDPTLDPAAEPVLIDNEPWSQQYLEDRGWSSFSRKFTLQDGQILTLSAAGNLGEDVMKRIAASIE